MFRTAAFGRALRKFNLGRPPFFAGGLFLFLPTDEQPDRLITSVIRVIPKQKPYKTDVSGPPLS